MKTNKQTYYGLFYKSRGEWTGPYQNTVLNANQVKSFVKNSLPRITEKLKSKTSFRKIKLA